MKWQDRQRIRSVDQWAVWVAFQLWPAMRSTGSGSWNDRHGIDAWDGDLKVQIKGDQTIAINGNLYHEFYEKTLGQEHQLWRRSPAPVDVFIFVTHGMAYRVPTDILAKAEVGQRLTKIRATSIGILVPRCHIPEDYWHMHIYRMPAVELVIT